MHGVTINLQGSRAVLNPCGSKFLFIELPSGNVFSICLCLQRQQTQLAPPQDRFPLCKRQQCCTVSSTVHREHFSGFWFCGVQVSLHDLRNLRKELHQFEHHNDEVFQVFCLHKYTHLLASRYTFALLPTDLRFLLCFVTGCSQCHTCHTLQHSLLSRIARATAML